MTGLVAPLDWKTPIVTRAGTPTPQFQRAWETLRGDANTPPMPAELQGLTLSTAGGSSSFGVAAGACCNPAATSWGRLGSALTKTTAAWAAGNGGALDTGTIAANTGYHAFLVWNATRSDSVVSLSATSPTLPSGFLYARRIGYMRTDASSHWLPFFQEGVTFTWALPVNDHPLATVGDMVAHNQALTVPTGVVVEAFGTAVISDPGVGSLMLVSSLLGPDNAPNTPAGNFTAYSNGTASGIGVGYVSVMTNTSAQVRYRMGSTTAGAQITTLGWRELFATAVTQ